MNCGVKRRTNPTWFTTPADSTASTIRCATVPSTASGFSQKTASPRSAAAATSRSCSDVHVVTNTASTTLEQFVLADGLGADAVGERAGPIGLRIVDGDDAMVGRRMLEEPVVCPADEPGPVEPDANGHASANVTSGVRHQM